MEILIKRLNEQAKMPAYEGTIGPGIELYANEETKIAPGEIVQVSTGIAVAVPVGYIGLIWNRKSIVIGEQLRVVTSVIDSGYREEVKVEVKNTGASEITLTAGEVVAQMLVHAVSRANLIEAEDLTEFNETEE